MQQRCKGDKNAVLEQWLEACESRQGLVRVLLIHLTCLGRDLASLVASYASSRLTVSQATDLTVHCLIPAPRQFALPPASPSSPSPLWPVCLPTKDKWLLVPMRFGGMRFQTRVSTASTDASGFFHACVCKGFTTFDDYHSQQWTIHLWGAIVLSSARFDKTRCRGPVAAGEHAIFWWQDVPCVPASVVLWTVGGCARRSAGTLLTFAWKVCLPPQTPHCQAVGHDNDDSLLMFCTSPDWSVQRILRITKSQRQLPSANHHHSGPPPVVEVLSSPVDNSAKCDCAVPVRHGNDANAAANDGDDNATFCIVPGLEEPILTRPCGCRVGFGRSVQMLTMLLDHRQP